MAAPERSRLAAYVDRFNARDFDAIRDLRADEVRLELVTQTRTNGWSEVAKYFHNYALALGFTEGRPLIVVFYRGFFCPRDRLQLSQLTACYPELVLSKSQS